MAKVELLGDDDYSGVDLFGLDEFGQPVGMNPMWGAIIGTGISTGVAICMRRYSPSHAKYSEGIGALAGIGAGAAMAFMGNARAAGWTAIATSAVSGGLRQLEALMSPETVSGAYGLATIDKGYPVLGDYSYGNEISVEPLGIATIEQTHQVLGDGNGPHLLGAAGAELVGVPGLSGLGSHYGATVFGGGN